MIFRKRLILTLAAALTLGGVAAAPAAAQTHRTVVRTTTTTAAPQPRERTVVRTSRTIVRHRTMTMHRGWNSGGHMGNHHRTCRTVWRNHRRIRTCRSW
jgi:Ni/Co efflux regulator RcnB